MSDGHGPQPAPEVPPPAPAPTAPPPPPSPAPPADAEADGVSLAAFITGLLSLGPVPLVLGIVGYQRSRRRGARAPWMAITGIVLGAVSTAGMLLIGPLLALSLLLVSHVSHGADWHHSGGSWSLTWDDPRGDRVARGDARP
ncbi:DUF4190 domain-containing protein [Cellulomonas sp.]|uniref:DUF4190 domain-containing protein n=1 Tax=Cellulomonas sp. TaxID=40001 RepID=UPI002D6FD490|nr:DUF4190 domain-containing protein [Cellulomonas sp.]HYQ75464.1 DUF4190 domain-containing protein [Cellulomonas sp.]